MRFVHLAFAVLATFRIVELFLVDRITVKLREKFPSYIWQCSRCLSVWAGGFAALAFMFCPWLNWPFALSWLYFVHNDFVTARHMANHGRQFVVDVKDGNWKVAKNELNQQEVQELLASVFMPQQPNFDAVQNQAKAPRGENQKSNGQGQKINRVELAN